MTSFVHRPPNRCTGNKIRLLQAGVTRIRARRQTGKATAYCREWFFRDKYGYSSDQMGRAGLLWVCSSAFGAPTDVSMVPAAQRQNTLCLMKE